MPNGLWKKDQKLPTYQTLIFRFELFGIKNTSWQPCLFTAICNVSILQEVHRLLAPNEIEICANSNWQKYVQKHSELENRWQTNEQNEEGARPKQRRTRNKRVANTSMRFLLKIFLKIQNLDLVHRESSSRSVPVKWHRQCHVSVLYRPIPTTSFHHNFSI